MLAAAETDDAAALARFDRVVFRHIGHTTMNACRSLFHGLSAGRFARAPKTRALRRFYRQLSLQSAGFAFLADIAMLVLGGELKRRERLSARFGDVLSHLYMASAVLKRFQDEGGQAADLPFVEWALMDSLHTIDDRIAAILDNFPSRWLAAALTMVVRPLGRRYRVPGDRLCNDVAALLMTPSDSRDRLIQGAFVNADPRDPVRVLQLALTLVDDAEATEGKIRRHTNAGRSITAAQIQAAIDDGIINDLERVRLQEFQHLLDAAIAVDQFEKTSQRTRNSAGDS
jgi:acyl-CoA dehydrogenase